MLNGLNVCSLLVENPLQKKSWLKSYVVPRITTCLRSCCTPQQWQQLILTGQNNLFKGFLHFYSHSFCLRIVWLLWVHTIVNMHWFHAAMNFFASGLCDNLFLTWVWSSCIPEQWQKLPLTMRKYLLNNFLHFDANSFWLGWQLFSKKALFENFVVPRTLLEVWSCCNSEKWHKPFSITPNNLLYKILHFYSHCF